MNKKNWHLMVFFVFLIVSFGAGAFYYVGISTSEGDGSSYLNLATHIKAGEGNILYEVNNYYPENGFMYPDCFWVSLYEYILAPFASPTPDFFIIAKLISVALALAALVIFYIASLAAFGRKTALLASALLATNCSFLYFSGIPRVEILLLSFVMLTVFFVAKGFRENKFWILAGIFNGFAYLTKGTGLLLLFVFILAVFAVYRFSIFRNKNFYFYIIAFLAVSSPLLIKNYADYGNPVFQCTSNHLLWEDSIEESKTAYFGEKPSLFTYLESHSAKDIVLRVAKGAFVTAPFKLLKLFEMDFLSNVLAIKFVSEKLSIITAALSALIMILALAGFWKFKDNKTKVYLGSFVFIILAFYVWLSPITSSKKHVIVFLPLALVFFSYFAVKKITEKGVVLIAVVLFIASSIFYVSAGINDPLTSHNIPPEGYDVIDWIKNNTDFENDVILECSRLYHYNWIYQRKMLFIPKADSMDDLQKHLRTFNATYAMVCSDYLNMKFNKKAFENNFFYDARIGLQEISPVEGWVLVYKDTIPPADYLIYKVNSS